MWLCKCDCGGENRLATSTLNCGLVKSCGCIKAELDKTRTRLHGMSDTKEYSRYLSMIYRCSVESHQAYPFYGAKGIRVCDRWLEPDGQGFLNYIEDMGEKPSEDYSVDRIDPLGDYSPENCRWADKHTQAVNQDIRKNNTSGRTGVSWDKKGKAWRAHISINRKRVFLGSFSSFEEAVKVREEAELKYYGFIKR